MQRLDIGDLADPVLIAQAKKRQQAR